MPMSIENGAGLTPVEAHARAVRRDRELLVSVAAVDLARVVAGAALVQVGVVARIPDHAVVAGLAEHLVVGVAAGERVIAGAAEQHVEAALAEQRVVADLAEQQVVARTAGDHVVAGAAEDLRGGKRAIRFVEGDRVVATLTEDRGSWLVLATVGVPPVMATAPPLMRMFPAASRLSVMVLSRLSPNTDEFADEMKVALTAIVVVS